VARGASVKLTAAAEAGSTFAKWSGACSGTGTCTVTLKSAATVTATFDLSKVQLTVQQAGTGSGTVISTPSGIDCPSTCSAKFPKGASVKLTASPRTGSAFAGWSGACAGSATCAVALTSAKLVTATFNDRTANLSLLNHIVFMVQENRSFDNYMGALREYWAESGYPDQSFDGLPQFNPASGIAPLYAPPPSNPGCDPSLPPPSDCSYDPSNPATSFHLNTVCTENTSPSWNEAHVDWDYTDPVGNNPAKMNGFVWTAAHDARTNEPPFFDSNGIRAMGYYDGSDLNYDYFMASNFATSDRWFNPEMARSNPNHEYLYAATSHGYVNTDGTNAKDTARIPAKTIFEALQDAGITWKIYVNPEDSSCTGPAYEPSCLATLTYLKNFTYEETVLAKYPHSIAPVSEYFSDLSHGTLPQVALIEPAYEAGLDEHGSEFDDAPHNIQKGSKYVSSIIDAMMESSAWSDSAFILTYDEAGGLYDHVPPQPTVSPDGIPPVDLNPGDVCTKSTGPTCNFVFTGYRIPVLVVSPYARRNYVSHTVADSTAILKFIETRFHLSALTRRDGAQPDMTEFFDFNSPPWMNPPTPPVQSTSAPCYLNTLP
jgi:phospholipase C